MTGKEILLIEPNYKNKYPPLGLMKISTFHKNKNDKVHFFKGTPGEYLKRFGEKKKWDRIYITTVFTFHYNYTIQAIKIAKRHTKWENIYVGGVAATLLADKYYKDTGIKPIKGLLDTEQKIGLKGDSKIDNMIPDYSILKQINYEYPTNDSYIGYATRGCIRKCPFCAVPELEPEYRDYYDLKEYVKKIKKKYGEKKHLLLLDNNVLASNKFETIIKDIKELGFERDAKTSSGVKRYVDFNQGLDARLLNEKKVKLLSEIAIRPARVAYDYVSQTKLYKEKIRLLANHGITELSNYLLFNFNDKPKDLYKRIKENIRLNEELGIKIYSFPMKFIPLNAIDRSYIGKYWTKKQLRAIQVILNATHGVVGPKRPFVMRAFGKSENDFETLLWMPEEYIMYREKHQENEAKQWIESFNLLSKQEQKILKDIIKDNRINQPLRKQKTCSNIENILKHYKLLQNKLKYSETKLYEFYL